MHFRVHSCEFKLKNIVLFSILSNLVSFDLVLIRNRLGGFSGISVHSGLDELFDHGCFLSGIVSRKIEMAVSQMLMDQLVGLDFAS